MRLIRGLNFLCFDKIKQTSWGYQGEWLASKFESKVKHRGATTLLLSRKRWTRNIYCWFNTHRERAKERAPPPPPLLTPVILQVIEYKLTVRVSYRTRWIIFERIITWPFINVLITFSSGRGRNADSCRLFKYFGRKLGPIFHRTVY